MIINDSSHPWREWNEELLSIACKSLTQELVLPSDAVGGMTKYRLSLCLSFFYKFYLEVQAFLEPGTVPAREKSSLQVTLCVIRVL